MSSRATYKRKMAIKKATKQLAIENKAKMIDDASALRKVIKPKKHIQKEDIPKTCSFCDSPEHMIGHHNTNNYFVVTCEKALEASNNKTQREQYQYELNKKWVNQVSTDNVVNTFNFNKPVSNNNDVVRPIERKNHIKISKNVFDMGD